MSEVTPTDEEFAARVREYGKTLASVAPIAARQTKRLMVRIDGPPDLPDYLGSELELALHGLASEDSAEAVRAMMARERPNFTGR